MKKLLIYIPVFFLALFTFSCSSGKNSAAEKEKKFREDALNTSVIFASGLLNNPAEEKGVGGAIILADSDRRLVIEPSKIYAGKINEDDDNDAIVTITSIRGKQTDILIHLILIAKDGKLSVAQSVESDMKIISISNRLITVQMPTHARTSPLFNCASCQEIQQYRFTDGKLEKLEINKAE
jgi:PBP1b-binding outer membrane lipoprotein LpoB